MRRCFYMFKKITILIVLMLMFSGCGSDKLVGDWKTWGRSAFDGSPELFILHIDKSDNGIYLSTQEYQCYSHESSSDRKTKNQVLTTARDEVLNAKEAINGNPNKMRLAFQDKYGTPKPKWTGIPLKIAQEYKRGGRKYKDVWQFNMDNLPLKDGKLLFNNLYYEKTDKAGIDKEMANYKEQLKKLVGKEITSQVNNVDGKLKSIITKVTIIENGKEEIFE